MIAPEAPPPLDGVSLTGPELARRLGLSPEGSGVRQAVSHARRRGESSIFIQGQRWHFSGEGANRRFTPAKPTP